MNLASHCSAIKINREQFTQDQIIIFQNKSYIFMEDKSRRLNCEVLAADLGELKKPVGTPKSSKIAHFGVGVFHRAHQSLYTQLAMEKT